MTWNWQQSDWPRFTLRCRGHSTFGSRNSYGNRALLVLFGHLDADEKDLLTVDLISTEALKRQRSKGLMVRPIYI